VWRATLNMNEVLSNSECICIIEGASDWLDALIKMDSFIGRYEEVAIYEAIEEYHTPSSAKN